MPFLSRPPLQSRARHLHLQATIQAGVGLALGSAWIPARNSLHCAFLAGRLAGTTLQPARERPTKEDGWQCRRVLVVVGRPAQQEVWSDLFCLPAGGGAAQAISNKKGHENNLWRGAYWQQREEGARWRAECNDPKGSYYLADFWTED